MSFGFANPVRSESHVLCFVCTELIPHGTDIEGVDKFSIGWVPSLLWTSSCIKESGALPMWEVWQWTRFRDPEDSTSWGLVRAAEFRTRRSDN